MRRTTRHIKRTFRSDNGRTLRLEYLESRQLLAGDLVAHWVADDLAETLQAEQALTTWNDRQAGIVAEVDQGTPKFAPQQFGGRAVVRFDAGDGTDALRIPKNANPLRTAEDFTVSIAFATNAEAVGADGHWYQNTGLVDASSVGFLRGWGIAINSQGQLSAGVENGFGQPIHTINSTAGSLMDGDLHVVTFVRASDTLSLYIDDLAVDERLNTASSPRVAMDIAIGQIQTKRHPYTGDIAEIRIYDGALTAQDVDSLHTAVQARYKNSAPVPVNDTYFAEEDVLLSIATPGPLENDIDADGDALTMAIVTPPVHGSLTANEAGSFVYEPQPNFFGIDTFTYRAIDFRESETVARVEIRVAGKNDPIQTQPDTYELLPTDRLEITSIDGVLANDLNLDQDPLRVSLASDASFGDLTLNVDGSFSFDPQGQSGVASFAYQVDDGTELSPSTTVTIIVNSPPAPSTDEYVTDEDINLAVDTLSGLLANDNDDDGNLLTVAAHELPQHGELILRADGSFDYTPLSNYYGDDQFSYLVSDGFDTSLPVVVQLDILAVNDPPSALPDHYFVLPDSTLNVPITRGLLTNDTDIEEQPLTTTLVNGASHGQVELLADGSFRYEPNTGFTGIDQFKYQAVDTSEKSEPTEVTLAVTDQPIVISEVMASNADTVETVLRTDITQSFDGLRLSPDWIEIRNLTDVPLDLGAVHLTDEQRDATKWKFPDGTWLEPRGYLTVFASGENISQTDLDHLGWLHTNFQLSTRGEYLALTTADGKEIHAFEKLPPQRTDISFGLANHLERTEFYETPTPGYPNNTGKLGLTPSPEFNVERGFVTEPFELTMTAQPESEIRYTTDGSEPTESSPLYLGPINVQKTTTLRARSFREHHVPSTTLTRTFLFLDDVVKQDEDQALAAGYPDKWSKFDPDYGFDSADELPMVVGDPTISVSDAREVLKQSLKAQPTLSIVMDIEDLFGDQGIYTNPNHRGRDWERGTSVELIHPDGTEGFQIDAGIRIQGGHFRNLSATRKKSFRLLFKTKYGPNELEYPLFGPSATDRFNTLTLRMASNDGWQWKDTTEPLYIRDEFMRRTQLAMGQPSSRGQYVHVYLNGLYWGVYNLIERTDASFAESYLGAEAHTWDGLSTWATMNGSGYPLRGSRTNKAWQTARDMAAAVATAETDAERTAAYFAVLGKNPDGSDNPELPAWIDVVNYADYMMSNHYGGNNDWPHNNVVFGRENTPDSEGFKFFNWDAELTVLMKSHPGSVLITDPRGVAEPFQNLRTSQEFRLLFADRVYQHMFNGGALYADPEHPTWDPEHPERNVPAARWVDLVDTMFDPIIAESARWGDQHREPAYTRDIEWRSAHERALVQWFAKRNSQLLKIYRKLDLYPELDVPVFNQRGGTLAADEAISLSTTSGSIYYTLDGSDPRQIGGSVAPNAILYDEPFQVDDLTHVRVRGLDGDQWSAIDDVTFSPKTQPANDEHLRITEVNFNPGPLTAEEQAAGVEDKDEFEFIEFTNISDTSIDLSNVHLAKTLAEDNQQGVSFRFADSHVTKLAPGERTVVVENLEAFELRYGTAISVAGQWSGGLSNASETITVMAGNQVLQQFTYSDEWHPAADGAGAALEVVNENQDASLWQQRKGWRAGPTNGTPGHASPKPVVVGDVNGDGVFTSDDLIVVFALNEYDDGIANNSTFGEGDWNGDGEFDSEDLVFAFTLGHYVA